MSIPKKLGHIWIGPLNPPTPWMESWRDHHPDWEYTLYDNDYLTGRRWRNQALITAYFENRKYAGVSDLMRYELLYENGGFLPEADSICLRPCDELFSDECAYTVYENEKLRPNLVSPILACEPGNDFVRRLIRSLRALTPETLGKPWMTTGNAFVRKMIRRHNPDIIIFPSHYFIPEHYKGAVYDGPGHAYADQKWGTTQRSYDQFNQSLTPRDHRRRRAPVIEALQARL